MAVDWADSLIKRAVIEPDGYLGWPGQWGRTKIINAGSGVDNLNEYNTDSFISDAMVFRPIVLLAREMATNPALKEKYGAKGESYLKLAGQLYEKWVERGGWREIEDGGMISVVLPYRDGRGQHGSGSVSTPGTIPATDSRTPTTRPTRSPAGCSRCGT